MGVDNGVPIILRNPSGNLTLANFMKMQIYSSLGALSIGCEILSNENVKIDSVYEFGFCEDEIYVCDSDRNVIERLR